MSEAAPMILACPCSAIELTVTGPPLAHLFCHCADCRRMHGGAYSPEAVHPASSVVVTRGDPAFWTLERNPRAWCPACGVRLFIDVLAAELRGLNGSLLPDGVFRPSLHMQCRFAVRPVVDDLPHYLGRAPMFGGSDERAGW